MRKVVCAAHHPGYRARESARMRTGGDPEYANDLGGSQAQRGARADSIARLIVWSVPAAASGRTWGAGQTGPIQGNRQAHSTQPRSGELTSLSRELSDRSEERRGGKESVSQCGFWWGRANLKKKK